MKQAQRRKQLQRRSDLWCRLRARIIEQRSTVLLRIALRYAVAISLLNPLVSCRTVSHESPAQKALPLQWPYAAQQDQGCRIAQALCQRSIHRSMGFRPGARSSAEWTSQHRLAG